MWDVIVAGAGPAGTAAAFRLASLKLRVLAADRVQAGGDRVGEALPGAAVRMLRAAGLPFPNSAGPHREIPGTASAWGSDELTLTDTLRDPYGPSWRLDRAQFDEDLRSAARTSGVAFRDSCIADVSGSAGCWHVRLKDGGQASARFILDASGRSAHVARRLGAKRLREHRLVALYRIANAGAVLADGRTFIASAPQGWWYAARLPSGRAIAGLHTSPETAARIAAEPDEWRRALIAAGPIAGRFGGLAFTHRLAPLDAGGARLDRLHGDGWMACGDAAMSFDPLSGQGLFAAIYGGLSSANAIAAVLAGETGPARSLSTELDEVWKIYCLRRNALYASECRWSSAPFWAGHTRLKTNSAAPYPLAAS
jgi:flavin-dependent dehydrogenase